METHSMFPAHWDEARIRREITSAWRGRNKKIYSNGKWEGVSSSGVKIEGWTTPRKTAYPIYEP